MDMTMNMTSAPTMMPGMEPVMMPAGSPQMHMGAMHGFFYVDPGFYYLFQGLYVATDGALIGACFASVGLALVLTILTGSFLKPLANRCDTVEKATTGGSLVSGLAHGIDCFFHYVLMLVAMTFNFGVLVSICVGCGLGHTVNIMLAKKKNNNSSSKDETTKENTELNVVSGCNH